MPISRALSKHEWTDREQLANLLGNRSRAGRCGVSTQSCRDLGRLPSGMKRRDAASTITPRERLHLLVFASKMTWCGTEGNNPWAF